MELIVKQHVRPGVPATQIPLGVLYNQQLSFGARLLYGALFRYDYRDEAPSPNQQTLARDLGCTARAVRNYLTELKTAGLLIMDPHVGSRPTTITCALSLNSLWITSAPILNNACAT